MCPSRDLNLQSRNEEGWARHQQQVRSSSSATLSSRLIIFPVSSLCPHFPLSRADLFAIVRIKKLKDFNTVLRVAGTGNNENAGVGCEICKPAVASILSSVWNEHVMLPKHHGLQETNDR